MLKVKSIKNVHFVGRYENIVTQLTCPFCTNRTDCYFYYKGIVYKITDENPAATVIVASALDFVRNFCDYVEYIHCVSNPILLITDKKCLRKFGLKLNMKVLSYALSIPVIHSRHPVNKLLDAIHMTCSVQKIHGLEFEKYLSLYKSCISLRRLFRKK